jgi:cyclase
VLKKRLVGVVTVKNGLAVQSIGYERYLPLGRPEILLENLDRWGADEILVQCIDRSVKGLGPDFLLLERIGRMGLSTPLIYAGGIRNAQDGRKAIQIAADRICVDALLHDDLSEVRRLGDILGAQAIISSLPMSVEDGELRWLDYRHGLHKPISEDLIKVFRSGILSEVVIVDWKHEGQRGKFDNQLIVNLPIDKIGVIAFGGLSEVEQIRNVLDLSQVVAIGIGNFLSFKEHAIQRFKIELGGGFLRPALFNSTIVR